MKTNAPKSFPYDLVTQSGCTYVIDRVISLAEDLDIADGVTLIFQGGRFENANYGNISDGTTPSAITIKAPTLHNSYNVPIKGVTIEAPLSVIFGRGINATGYWICRYSSPVWFEAEEKEHHIKEAHKVFDFADPIDRAIEMKQTGIVFLPKGDYFISRPIKIPVGITLQGEKSNGKSGFSTVINPLGTRPKTTKESDSDQNKLEYNKTYPYNYLFLVNCDYNSIQCPKPTQITELPVPWTAIQDLEIKNAFEVNTKCRCIYACGGAMFKNIGWGDFIQALAYSMNYADGKAIIECNAGFSENFKYTIQSDEANELRNFYLFDMGGLGDSVLFMHNHIAEHPLGKALFINMCGGGSFQGNIINSDVYILGSKSVSFTDNHIEGGAQILIEDSIVATKSNFIYKGTRPSIVIRKNKYLNPDGTETINPYCPIVTMVNDQFLFYTRPASPKENEEQSNNKDFGTNDWPLRRQRLESISEYDIDIDPNTTLSLINVFRYDIANAFDELFPFGILITSPDGPVNEFNNHSYFCSQQSTIMSHYLVRADYKADNLNIPSCFIYGDSNGNPLQQIIIPWFAPSGSYKYSYVIEWDPNRIIVGMGNNNEVIRNMGTAIFSGVGQHGLLLRPSSELISSYNFQIRLYREYTGPNGEKKMETVAVPVCGSMVMYDNGFSIAGYRWKTLDNLIVASIITPKYEVYRYASGHVEAFANSLPTSTIGWSKGDIIYNVGDSTGWEQKIIR